MAMIKLVAKEYEAKEGDEYVGVGDKYSYFVDPETGKLYRPKDGFEVTGEDLSKGFIEVEV